ncbi:MAG: ComEA family DNA-binding protein [Anaerotignum sp.]|nr:ComEA family DNA-binding protein [Anaerotignum sp.]
MLNIRKKQKILLVVIMFFAFGLRLASVKDGNSLEMGASITIDGLEERWAEEYVLFLPGTIEKININTAEQEVLEALPGVGEKLAQEIIIYREENGLFHSTDEIINVSGIGIKKLSQMKEFIIVE